MSTSWCQQPSWVAQRGADQRARKRAPVLCAAGSSSSGAAAAASNSSNGGAGAGSSSCWEPFSASHSRAVKISSMPQDELMAAIEPRAAVAPVIGPVVKDVLTGAAGNVLADQFTGGSGGNGSDAELQHLRAEVQHHRAKAQHRRLMDAMHAVALQSALDARAREAARHQAAEAEWNKERAELMKSIADMTAADKQVAQPRPSDGAEG